VDADPPHRPLADESAAERATRIAPISGCHRRLAGTDTRGSVPARPAGSTRRQARFVFTSEARAAVAASGLERQTHDPDIRPSYRLPQARGPETSRVSEPAPLRVRPRRGLRMQHGQGVFPGQGRWPYPRTQVARRCSPLVASPHRRGVVELVRAFRERARALPGVAGKMRPIDFCTPKHSNSSTRASPFPSAATVFDRASRPALTPIALVPSLAARAHPRERVFFRAPPSRIARKRGCEERAPAGSGPSGAGKAGEHRGSRHDAHFDGPKKVGAQGVVFPTAPSEKAVSDTPVASLRRAMRRIRGRSRPIRRAAKIGSAGAL